MATFTLEFRDYLSYYGTDTLSMSGERTYPLFDEDHRETLNQKIIERFYMREIGCETPDMFAHRFRRKLNELMPYYNQLYATEKLEFDPFITVSLNTKANREENSTANAQSNSTTDATSTTDGATTAKETLDQSVNQTSGSETDTTSDGTSKSRTVASVTPQTMLSGSEDYATNAQDTNSISHSEGTSNSSATTDTDTDATTDTTATEHEDAESSSQTSTSGERSGKVDTDSDSTTTGYQGLPSNLLMEFRRTILNIDLQILDELDELFMQVWGTNDNYTQNNNYLGYPAIRFGYGY